MHTSNRQEYKRFSRSRLGSVIYNILSTSSDYLYETHLYMLHARDGGIEHNSVGVRARAFDQSRSSLPAALAISPCNLFLFAAFSASTSRLARRLC